MANFLVESSIEEPSNKEKDRWMLHVDGSSNKNMGGVILILVTPEGDPLHYALWLLFKTLNNEAKYKALIIGLNLEKALMA